MFSEVSKSFELLDKKIQKWIWQQGWTNLHDIQEQAIEPILKRNTDIVISSATASGKTEAAFLPIASYLIQNPSNCYQVLYISPLKALINDQARRIEELCEPFGIQITAWHGDISASKKRNSIKKPSGILLITPESIESLFINHGSALDNAFSRLCYIVIDEFHSFIGTERGCHLQSLIHRLDNIKNEKNIPRIALSATLGDIDSIRSYLRPGCGYPYKPIKSSTLVSDIKLQVKGYLESAPDIEHPLPTVAETIGNHLFKVLRGSSNLVFANSRQNTEYYADMLTQRCAKEGVPNEFFPHHGNLSKELRLEVEQRLLKGDFPTTAICTMTLELGIDIGSVNSIAQIGSPFSVSSMRQRLGRSGRRDKASILRIYISETELDAKSNLIDKFRPELIQAIAMVNLLLKKEYEPPDANQYHFSTLVQQVLSLITQKGGFHADQGWDLLCRDGAFRKVTKKLFADLLRSLGKSNIINQDHDGSIVLGEAGERIVNHYSFYSAFITPEEYRLEVQGRVIGSLPIDSPLTEGSFVIFAGKRWEVLSVSDELKLIRLRQAAGGKVPKFSGQGMMIHDFIRQEMKKVYQNDDIPAYLDETAVKLLIEARSSFKQLKLDSNSILESGASLYIFPWKGDKVINSLTLMLRSLGLRVQNNGFFVEIEKCTTNELRTLLNEWTNNDPPDAINLAQTVKNKLNCKYDHLLSESLLNLDFASKYLSIDDSWAFIQELQISI